MTEEKEEKVVEKVEPKKVEDSDEEDSDEEEPMKKVEEELTYGLCCHWTENEWLTYESMVSKWENVHDWNYLPSHEPMMPFVYKLAFKEFMVQLESDKNSMSLEDVFEKYTGETDLV
tara:strand:- start:113 stop:463 length:351 start_codon:yes stop_codon:yes gene_type:complete